MASPYHSYAISVLWLMREIEAAACKLAHGHVNRLAGVATLFLPASKTDVGGHGKARSLRCCGQEVCCDLCPVKLVAEAMESTESITGVSREDPGAWETPLFPTVAGKSK